jgi:hypothetical protein
MMKKSEYVTGHACIATASTETLRFSMFTYTEKVETTSSMDVKLL